MHNGYLLEALLRFAPTASEPMISSTPPLRVDESKFPFTVDFMLVEMVADNGVFSTAAACHLVMFFSSDCVDDISPAIERVIRLTLLP